ncbi:phosphoribosylanthranilate isomerase [Pelotomaculum isophthalicicum JI]|uniref:N-(5'-phosphoribosyl)anthranilate isomerase n=1 Tax=Pelotomaculum isophthalicicum JI TaxID=947010 RepID=A0A9X4JUX8_9FIRM|nr:phosphoribosylanthranilate isomerase [Pelotomaculum isophthalicicum]MDF9407136.1 phosphoribosylanthranilate isomerase [Pelotomaculum isophthalicicum JI]
MKAGCRVKICGITNIEDAKLSAGEGADYIGVVIEVSYSPRSQTVKSAEPIFANAPVPAVALVHEMQPDRLTELVTCLKPFAVQFLSQDGAAMAGQLKKIAPGMEIWQSLFLPASGDSSSAFDCGTMLKQVEQCKEAGVDAVVLDTAAVINGVVRFGGTGTTGRWDQAAQVVADSTLPAFLAGGIKPENVREAVESVRPYGIDLCSGVELHTGIKSLAKLRSLMEEVQKAGGINKC